ncbi:putative ATP-dependent RNA helicase DHX57 isoform X2 [Eurosta solidaginis]|uniref:putative ATP-dependent RNA helicase DHX57 isoform X2 n=1 Tax=Eurosta solidaginis TaxID=178769 RepID=UPI0035310E12
MSFCTFGSSKQRQANNDELRKKQGFLNDNEEENWFFLEIRFQPNTKYPYEASLIYLKKTCHEITKKKEDELIRELEHSDIKSEAAVPGKSIRDDKFTLEQMHGRYSEPMKINPELAESVLKYIVEGGNVWPKEGTIVVFVPGLREIQAIHEALGDSVLFGKRSANFIVIPLYSWLTSEEQSAIFRPAPNGKRKIVLGTNIAETLITIDDCVFLIDLGLMKEKRFDSNRNMESLEFVWVSRTNDLQRK